ncbi:MAG: ribosome-associated translation inhibitor RaiA [Prevotella sp.]|jgi:putative sigma-54 modulation protein|nr:ribosome-associated translation inhibitor RaiA [Prevotella sp.]
MEIRIQAIHFDVAEKLTEFIRKKVSKLEKYSDGIIDAEVTLKVVKPETANNKEAAIKLNTKNGDFFASKIADTFEEAIDLNVEAIEKQVRKIKEKTHTKGAF